MLLTALTGFQLQHQLREPPVVPIADIKPYMNFSIIAVRGKLASEPLRLRSGSILFTVDDGTGMLAVFSDAPHQLLTARIGDPVRAEGHLSVGAGRNIRLQVRSADGVVLEQESRKWMNRGGAVLSRITSARQGDCVTVTGAVHEVRRPAPGSREPHRITLTDGVTCLDTVNWMKQPPDVRPGDRISMTGRVQVYKGRVELRLMDGAEIRTVD
jgi:DNA/RNA endonuclease YhcR with UshA esterase domain